MVNPASVARLTLVVAASSIALAACSKKEAAPADTNVATTDVAVTNTTDATAAAPAATLTVTAAPAADNVDTVSGAKLASFTGDAARGATVFISCKTCHAIEAGVNKIGPSLHNVVGRKSGSVPGFAYSSANSGSGITWTPEKLFQYLENPQRVVPGTKMGFHLPEEQKRADVIAYLKAN